MIRRACLALLLVSSSCMTCSSPVVKLKPNLRGPEAVALGEIFVGRRGSALVDVTNAGTAPTTVSVSIDAPFEVDATELSVERGVTVELTVSLVATEPRLITGVLRVGELSITVTAMGVEVPMCSAPAACEEISFDFDAGVCVTTQRPENASCEDACVIGQCLAGRCSGAFRDCRDSNACTVESCSLSEGCLHTPRMCPEPSNPCQVATCDPLTGCGMRTADDGTLCGPDECTNQQVAVCLAGACVMRTRPASARCVNTWVAMAVPARFGQSLAFDAARNRTIMFGGNSDETWEYDGTRWTQRFPVGRPSPRSEAAMTWDPFRRRAVLFGGHGNLGSLGDTWEWDGVTWTQKQPVNAPPASWAQTMTYDVARQRVVLFSLGHTWEWDGIDWTIRGPPAGGPYMRSGATMAYDPVRQRVVLFGGKTDVFETTTWEWDGTAWSLRPTSIAPRASTGATMVWDGRSQRIMLFGGYRNLGTPEFFDELWQWDGTIWTKVQRSTPWPTARQAAASVWDSTRMRVVMFGGNDQSGANLPQTWEWDGARWTSSPPLVAPSDRSSSSMTWDSARSRVVLFGGALSGGVRSADTWEWDGLAWSMAQPLTSPAGRIAHAMGFDRARQRVVMFGGIGTSSNLLDTWQYDGSNWVQLFPASAPTANGVGTLSWDSANQRLLMVWAPTPGVAPIELWSFDGTTWTNTQTPWPGGSCSSSSSAFDVARSRLVLFCNGTAQTWELTGTAWAQVSTTDQPTPRGSSSMVWNPARQRITLFGGSAASLTEAGETWEYDGAQWTQLLPGASPTGTVRSSMVYDEARQRLTLFDGSSTYVYLP